MEHSALDFVSLAWFAGWLAAVVVLLAAGWRLPLQTRWRPAANLLYQTAVLVLALGVAVLANVAIVLHDVHFDLTREKTYTPSANAMQVVSELEQPVALTYFVRGQDPGGQRMRTVLEQMARSNRQLQLRIVDPDREPAVARAAGLRGANTAVLEADGRRVQIETTDERQIAIGIQRVLRTEVQTVCFLEGHNELPIDNFEFHTHLESVSDHSHDDASSSVVLTSGHGIGRLRRALEAQGYEIRKIALVGTPEVPPACRLLVLAGPRTTFVPSESLAITRFLERGGALLAMLDLGFVPDPALDRLLDRLGLALPPRVVVDPLSHYSSDAQIVAVTAYEASPITRNLSMSFFPGVRPLFRTDPEPGLVLTPLFSSSRDSYLRETRTVQLGDTEPRSGRSGGAGAPDDSPTSGDPGPRLAETGPQLLAVAVEGRLAESQPDSMPMRAIVVGDSDFASNSFLPYLANSDLALAMTRWLLREERLTTVATRIPVPPMIVLTNPQMQAIFVLIVIALPMIAVLLGMLVWWRRR
ncbi:MAG: GldG family protein [Limnobacter sp.]|nr:GldG family protein [Limnobacter sp.]